MNPSRGWPRPAFFSQPTELVARQLIGKIINRQEGQVRLTCRIVETEAYLPKNDHACHASQRKTPRNSVMFGRAGLVYVYSIHARYCVNIVTEKEGLGCAVLIRSAEPLKGIPVFKKRRGIDEERNLLNGPAKLCQALAIDKLFNGTALDETNGFWISDDGLEVDDVDIRVTHRIGVTRAKRKKLRFVIRGSAFASGPRSMR